MLQPLRRFLGRQPLCGSGVTSLTQVTSMPMFCSVRTAVSRPEPVPLTMRSSWRMPCSPARRAASSAATCAAYGVDLRDPLKPTEPPEVHATVAPVWSGMVVIVLLKLALIWAWPCEMFLRSRRRTRFAPCCFATYKLLLRDLFLAGNGNAPAFPAPR